MHEVENRNVLRNICRIFALTGSEWEFALWSGVCKFTPNRSMRNVVSIHRGDEQVRGELLGFLSDAKFVMQRNFHEHYAAAEDHLVFYDAYKHHMSRHIAQAIHRIPTRQSWPTTIDAA